MYRWMNLLERLPPPSISNLRNRYYCGGCAVRRVSGTVSSKQHALALGFQAPRAVPSNKLEGGLSRVRHTNGGRRDPATLCTVATEGGHPLRSSTTERDTKNEGSETILARKKKRNGERRLT